MAKDFTFLRTWLTGEGYPPGSLPRPVILEYRRSKSGQSLSVFDRTDLLFRVKGFGFHLIGTALVGMALARFLEKLFQPELNALAKAQTDWAPHLPADISGNRYPTRFPGLEWNALTGRSSLEGATGFDSMGRIADGIGLSAEGYQLKNSSIILITKKG